MSYRIVSYAEVLPWTMSTDFGADSSSHFPSRARTDRQTDATERPTHAGGYVAGVGDIGPSFGKFTAINARGSSCLASSVNKPGDRLQAWLLAAAGIFFGRQQDHGPISEACEFRLWHFAMEVSTARH